MKTTKRQLKRIIKEEKAKLLRENMRDDYAEMGNFDGAMLDLDDYDDLRESVIEFARGYAANTGYETDDILMALKSIIGEI